jgi:hypothetical protein
VRESKRLGPHKAKGCFLRKKSRLGRKVTSVAASDFLVCTVWRSLARTGAFGTCNSKLSGFKLVLNATGRISLAEAQKSALAGTSNAPTMQEQGTLIEPRARCKWQYADLTLPLSLSKDLERVFVLCGKSNRHREETKSPVVKEFTSTVYQLLACQINHGHASRPLTSWRTLLFLVLCRT